NLKLNLDAKNIRRIEPVKRGASGRLILVKVIFEDESGAIQERVVKDQYVIRESFHEIFLYSSAFVVDTEGQSEIPDVFILKGAGWGHGAGYCQIGALGMSLKGYKTGEILNHYYPGAKLKKIY
ncbi:MAG: amidase, partial [Candidatus Marinimicrobia bacterium]|nr:amidase [Candidatus Neomarinimicrobiota bacterium]